MTVRNTTFEDMALAADVMVTSFRTAYQIAKQIFCGTVKRQKLMPQGNN